MFDFSSVREVDGKRSAGFEELCVRLSEALCGGSVVELLRVDGAGGDGGVEAIVKTSDGREIGIQSKYFVSSLGQSQWKQIEKSVSQALTKHPSLTDYFVCVPRDRSPAAHTKWGAMTKSWSKNHPRLRVTWFGRSELSSLLAQPSWSHLATYWLGSPLFSTDWARERSELAIRQLHRRFTPSLHNKTRAERGLSRMLALEAARMEYRYLSERLAVKVRQLVPKLRDSSWPAEASDLPSLCLKALEASEAVLLGMCDGSIVDQGDGFGKSIDALEHALGEVAGAAWTEDWRLQSEKKPDTERYAANSIAREVSSARSLVEELQTHFSAYYDAMPKAVWLLTGSAGTGKSHLLATVVRRVLDEGGAAVMVIGEQFIDSRPVASQICELLGWSGTLGDLLACLQAHSQSSGRPSLVVVDAINEAPTRGIWLAQLLQLEAEVARHAGVHLLLSCRQDWLESCIPSLLLSGAPQIEHTGYDMGFEQAVSAYFAGYNVTAEVFPPLVPEFRNPLFLKTVCETYEGRRLPSEPLSFATVLAAWERRICERIEQVIDCPIVQTQSAIRKILEKMAMDQVSSLSEESVRAICLGAFSNDTASKSLYRHLQSFGLLEEVQRAGATFVRLQYERFFDVRVVEVEIARLADASAWKSYWRTSVLPKLAKPGAATVSRARLFAYALLLPDRFGLELVECALPRASGTSWSHPADSLWDAWLSSLAWRRISPSDTKKVSQKFLAWANGGRRHGDVYGRLIGFACITEHPLNADFLHRVLLNMPLPKRECLWTIPLAEEDLSAEGEGDLRDFVDWCESACDRASDEQARLAATVLIWLTSTTNHSNRDKVTRVAIRVLAGREKSVIAVTSAFWEVDDPYVKERLLAVLAGVIPTLTPDGARKLGNDVCRRFFDSGDVPLNLLQREYMRFIADFCESQGVLEPQLTLKARAPYATKKPRVWTEARVRRFEKNDAYRDIASSLYPEEMGPGMYGDFGRYVMGSAVHNFVDDSKPDPSARTAYLRYPQEDARRARRYIWSRVIELGWTPDLFQEFERSLRSNGRQRPAVERISKKYQWIGLYEYVGYLSDHRKYRSWSDELDTSAAAWQLLLRDFSPAKVFFDHDDENAGETQGLMATEKCSPIPRMKSLSERVSWTRSRFEPLRRYLHVSIAERPRLVLHAHINYEEELDFGVTRDRAESGGQWIDVRSFVTPRDHVARLVERLRTRTFWGHGCDLPKAYECWPSEYPWHVMLDAVEESCSEGYPWLALTDGPLHGTACSLESEGSRFTVPSPGIVREMGKSAMGPLSAPRPFGEAGYRIDTSSSAPVFWGSVHGSSLLAVDFDALSGWLAERNWSLLWCVLSERRATRGYGFLAAESHTSTIFVLEPDGSLVEVQAVRNDWVHESQRA